MEINTKEKETKYYVAVGICILFIAIFYHIQNKPDYFYGRIGEKIDSLHCLEISIGLLLLVFLYRPSHFEFNDTDQVVIVKGRRLLLGQFLFKRTINLELPKRKIRRVRIQKKYFREYLSITVNSKHSIKRTKSVDLSLLNKQEKKLVLESLKDIATHQEAENNYGKTIRKQ